MPASKMIGKGQITMPKAVRELASSALDLVVAGTREGITGAPVKERHLPGLIQNR